MENSYTEEELAALPMTEAVLDKPPVVFDDHQWVQMGYVVHDHCQPRGAACQEVGISIPSGTVLKRENGRYVLRPETRRH